MGSFLVVHTVSQLVPEIIVTDIGYLSDNNGGEYTHEAEYTLHHVSEELSLTTTPPDQSSRDATSQKSKN